MFVSGFHELNYDYFFPLSEKKSANVMAKGEVTPYKKWAWIFMCDISQFDSVCRKLGYCFQSVLLVKGAVLLIFSNTEKFTLYLWESKYLPF